MDIIGRILQIIGLTIGGFFLVGMVLFSLAETVFGTSDSSRNNDNQSVSFLFIGVAVAVFLLGSRLRK